MRRGRRAVLCLALLGLLSVVAPAAADEPPSYNGMVFPAISGVDGPEEFTWRVQMGPEQELVEVDSQLAEVRYEDGLRAFAITPRAAHDSDGSAVPTSLRVSGTDLITLTVHHRGGNPAAGSSPFVYPVTGGVGWEGGFVTHPVQMPPSLPLPTQPAAPGPRCLVPGLLGRDLGSDRRRLNRAGCTLGKVRGARGVGARVVKQSAEPGTSLPAGARVHVKLG